MGGKSNKSKKTNKKTAYQNRMKQIRENQKNKYEEDKEKEKAETFSKKMGWKTETELEINKKWCENISDTYFKKWNKDIVIGIDGKETTELLQKRYNKKKPPRLCKYYDTILNKDKFMIFLDNFKTDWDIVSDIDISKYEEVLEQVIFKVKVNFLMKPPVANGEDNNFCVGFMGSIWVDKTIKMDNDTIIKVRLGFYNDKEIIDKMFKSSKKKHKLIIMDYYNDMVDYKP